MINEALMDILNGKDPIEVHKNMMENDPDFKYFVEKHRQMSVDEIAREYDIKSSLLSCNLK